MRRAVTAIILLVLVAGISARTAAGADAGPAESAFKGRGQGKGQCLILSTTEFMCRFSGKFSGRLDGIRRTGTWTLKFEAPFSGAAGSPTALVANEEIKTVRFAFAVAPKDDLPGQRIVSPRDAASGLPTGIVTDNNDPDGLYLALTSPVQGHPELTLSLSAKIKSGVPMGVFHQITWD